MIGLVRQLLDFIMMAQPHRHRWHPKQRQQQQQPGHGVALDVGAMRMRRNLGALLFSLQLGSSITSAFQAIPPLAAPAAARRHNIMTPSQRRASLQTPLPDSIPSSSDTAPSPSEETNLLSLLTQHHDTHTTTITTTQIISTSAISSTSKSSSSSSTSHVLSLDEIKPIFKFEKNGKQKMLNLYGLYHLFVIVLTMPFWMASMDMLHWLGNSIDGFDEDRAKFDYAGKLWCRAYLTLTDCYPIIDGDVSRLQEKVVGTVSTSTSSSSSAPAENGSGACLFVANHASFLDIAVLCCVLNPVFKFIAKDSLMKFPGVGRQLVGVSTSARCFLHYLRDGV